MIFDIIQYSIVSLIFISIVHYLISHLTDNLTTPQVRDIVTSTNKQYEAIIKKLENGKNSGRNPPGTGEMKDELKQYLKSLEKAPSSQSKNHQLDSNGIDFASPSVPVQRSGDNQNSALMTYDSSDSVFGNYDGDAYSSY